MPFEALSPLVEDRVSRDCSVDWAESILDYSAKAAENCSRTNKPVVEHGWTHIYTGNCRLRRREDLRTTSFKALRPRSGILKVAQGQRKWRRSISRVGC